MKKITIILLIIGLFLLSGCTSEEHERFVFLENVNEASLFYDTTSGAMYYFRGWGMTPCYTWDEVENDFHIAHYPEDWDGVK